MVKKLGRKQIDIDFHFGEHVPHMLEATDPAAMIRMVKAANADTVMVYAKDHWGNVYHETSISHKHRFVQRDLLREWLDACRSEGVQSTVFFSVCWDEHAAAENPDWIARLPDGGAKRWYGSWTFMCINSPYRDYVMNHMRELVTHYDFDTIFIDPFNYRLGVNAPCYCEYCQKLWRAEFGTAIPHPLVGADKARYMDFRNRYFSRFLQELYGVVRAAGKGIQITHIFGTVTDHDDYLNVEGDPFGQDYYTNSVKAKIFRSYANGRPLVCLTERFSRYWDWTRKTREQLLWEAATVFAHNAGLMIVDHADVHGELEPRAYEEMGWVYRQVERIEQALDGATPQAEVALLYSERDEELLQDPLAVSAKADQHLSTIYRGHVPDFAGAFKVLNEMHIPFDVVVGPRLTAAELKRYRVLVIPGTIHMSPEQVQTVQDYVREGGQVVFTHRSATRDENGAPLAAALCSLGMVDVQLECPYTTTFVEPAFASELRYLRVNNGNAYVAPRGEAAVLGWINVTDVERTDRKWITHNDIPGKRTENPAILLGRYGQGGYLYFSFPFFREAVEQDLRGYREIFATALGRVYTPSVQVDGPRTLEANYYATAEGQKVVLTNYTGGRLSGRFDVVTPTPEPLSYPSNIEEIIPIAGVQIRLQRPVTEAITLDGERLPVTQADGGSVITVPRLATFEVVTIR